VEAREAPITSNAVPGVAVPIPTSPALLTTNGVVSPETSLTIKEFPVPKLSTVRAGAEAVALFSIIWAK